MVAKIIAHGADRAQAVQRLDRALAACVIEGIKTNIPFVRSVLASEAFARGDVHTGLGAEVLRESRAPAAA
jgi:acetyl/propionyl-CoA carboxylase alpha subunit